MEKHTAAFSIVGLDRRDRRQTEVDARLMTAIEGVGDALVALSKAVKDALEPRERDTAADLEWRTNALITCLRLAACLPTEVGFALTRQLQRFGNARLAAVVDRAFCLGGDGWVADQFEHGERLWDPLLILQHLLGQRAWGEIEAVFARAGARPEIRLGTSG